MRTLHARLLAALVSAAVSSLPLSARGQAATAPRPEVVASARAHFTHGVKLYEEDDFRAALIEFSRAYELAPNWAVLYNVGQSYYQLRDYANALRTLERYEQEGKDRIATERRAQVDREMEELRGRVARVTLTTSIDDADLMLDDVPLGRSPLQAPVLIGAGRHKLTASRAGYLGATKVLDIAGGDNLSIGLDLTPEARAPEAPAAAPSYAPAVFFAGVGVAGIAVGAVFGALAIGNKSSLDRECDARKVCPSSSQGDIEALSRNGAISTVGFGAGLAGVVLATFFLVRERPDVSSGEKKATVTPWIGPGGAGLTGSF